jgi:hypothetical protein
VRGDHGENLEVVNRPAETSSAARLTVLFAVEVHQLDRCPVCLKPELTA